MNSAIKIALEFHENARGTSSVGHLRSRNNRVASHKCSVVKNIDWRRIEATSRGLRSEGDLYGTEFDQAVHEEKKC